MATANKINEAALAVIKWAATKWETEPASYCKGKQATDEWGSALNKRDDIIKRGVRFDLSSLLMVGAAALGEGPEVENEAHRLAAEALRRNEGYAKWSLLELSDHRGREAAIAVLRSALDGSVPKLPPIKGSTSRKNGK